MTELTSDHPVRVTAEERAHPALRKLARACIAIALLQLADESSVHTADPSPTPAAEQPKEEPAVSSQEGQHG